MPLAKANISYLTLRISLHAYQSRKDRATYGNLIKQAHQYMTPDRVTASSNYTLSRRGNVS